MAHVVCLVVCVPFTCFQAPLFWTILALAALVFFSVLNWCCCLFPSGGAGRGKAQAPVILVFDLPQFCVYIFFAEEGGYTRACQSVALKTYHRTVNGWGLFGLSLLRCNYVRCGEIRSPTYVHQVNVKFVTKQAQLGLLHTVVVEGRLRDITLW